MTTLHDFTATTIDGEEQALADFSRQAVLVVNTASECGLTPQYEDLQDLYAEHSGEGFVVLGFPCNQFGEQEPGSEAEIKRFVTEKFGVTFPMFSKVEVNGESAHPLFAWLREQSGGEDVEWNFAKFLVNGDGELVKRYSPRTTPAEMGGDVTRLLEIGL
ncbi:glutathione peroxidase [Kytococcus sedentarius]|uniref:glutathione peroxidase n=1 Tax=Kytococcus sedentarius TaxID=1276 RepID=UPI00384EC4E0